MEAYAAVLLAGGAARRMGGRDKPAVPVAGRAMRDRVLAAVATAERRVVVGPPAPVPVGVVVTREDPPGGGPVAAIAARLARLDPATPVVALLAADLPLLGAEHVDELRERLAAGSGVAADAARYADGARYADRARYADGACYVDGTGRRQSLCGVWRHEPLRRAVRHLAAARGGDLACASMRALLTVLAVVEVRWAGAGAPPWFDCDTDDDVRRAEEWIE